jgi:hypothetical protein
MPVIPAKAGIQSLDSLFLKTCGVDSRFRGNDCDFERSSLANDTSAEIHDTEIHEGLQFPGFRVNCNSSGFSMSEN